MPANKPQSDRERELIRQIDALERKLGIAKGDMLPGAPLGPRSNDIQWPKPSWADLKTGITPNPEAIISTADAMMAIPGPAQLLLPPQFRGLGPAGIINEIATEINAQYELRQPSPAEKADREYGKAFEARIRAKGPGPRQGRRFR